MDRLDARLLTLLQRDGRMTTVDLAERLRLSPTATADRLKRLTRDGYILGYAARLDPVRLGLAFLVFVEVTLDKTTADVFDQFAEAARRTPEILDCHMVAGGFDYLIKVRLPDMNAYRAFLGDILVGLPGVRETRTYAVMEEIKSETPLPLR